MIDTHIPIELMNILNAIKNDVSEVKERIINIEAQNHSDSINSIRQEIKEEREKRMSLEIKLAEMRTKIAPIMIGLSILGAGVVDFVGRMILKY